MNDVIKAIERACEEKLNHLYIYNAAEEDLRKGFESFINRRTELSRIRSIASSIKLLPVIEEYIEAEKIEYLDIWDCDTECELPVFDKLKNLKCLKIKGTKFNPANIFKLKTLTELHLSLENDINDLSDCICSLKDLFVLDIYKASSAEIFDWLGNITSLNKLIISGCNNLKKLPEGIGNLKNLIDLKISSLPLIEQLPDNIGSLQSLTNLSIFHNDNIKTLPESIGNLQSLKKLYINMNKNFKTLPNSICNLKKLTHLYISYSPYFEKLPDNIGRLQSLKELSLDENIYLKALPESIGNLSNLTFLDINNSVSIKNLPDSIKNLNNLEYLNIFGTSIDSIPQFTSSVDIIANNKRLVIIPMDESISYHGFINWYYILLRNLIRYNNTARKEGIMSLVCDLDYIEDGFFKEGLRLLVDMNDAKIIRRVLEISIEHENNYYRKKLMSIAMEGILCILNSDTTERLIFGLNLMVDIKDNPVNAAYKDYLAGNKNAFNDIKFSSFIKPEGEREEIRFIKRAYQLSEKSRRDGFASLENCIDAEAAANGEIFEYGVSLLFKDCGDDEWLGLGVKYINAILDKIIEREIDPVQKNIALAKKEAVLSIYASDSSWILFKKLTAFFDKSIENAFEVESLKA